MEQKEHEVIARTEIHQSDIRSFLRCRRRWDWGTRKNLRPFGVGNVSEALWFGSGWHYALEDFHGWNKHKTAYDAYLHYQESFPLDHRPDKWRDLTPLAKGMIDHYLEWSKYRERFTTLRLPPTPEYPGGRPLVEVDFHIPLPEEEIGHSGVTFSGTIDRFVKDEYDQLWLIDYKTVSKFDNEKLEMDPQVSSYAWAVRTAMDLKVQGMIFWEFRKSFPETPTLLKSGGLSLNRAQNTNYRLFVKYAKTLYGDEWYNAQHKVDKEGNESSCGLYADWLEDQENEWGDKHIRITKVYRNDAQLDSTYEQILAQTRDMLNPDLPIYPNPSYLCSRDCSFRAPCAAQDDGSDVEMMIEDAYEPEAPGSRHAWRDRVSIDVIEI